MTIKISTAGLRGTTDGNRDDILGPDVVLDWARAYATALVRETGTAPVVAIARDGRRSSPPPTTTGHCRATFLRLLRR